MSIKKEQTYSLDLEFVNQRIDNPYKTEIDLGDPSQRMPGFLKTDEFGFFLSNQGCPHSAFYFKGSKDFKYITPKEYFDEGEISNYQISDSIFLQKLNETEDSNETQYINTKIENYLLSVDNSMKGQQCFHVGTQISLKGGSSLLEQYGQKNSDSSAVQVFPQDLHLNVAGMNITDIIAPSAGVFLDSEAKINVTSSGLILLRVPALSKTLLIFLSLKMRQKS